MFMHNKNAECEYEYIKLWSPFFCDLTKTSNDLHNICEVTKDGLKGRYLVR